MFVLFRKSVLSENFFYIYDEMTDCPTKYVIIAIIIFHLVLL